MKKQSFIIGALILTIGGIIAKVIGAFYKIPLTNILGSNGMGLYYLVFPLYSLMFVFASSGISMALSKCVAQERINKNKKNESMYFNCALVISFLLSLIFMLILIMFSKNISYAQGNINAFRSYIAIAPALVCSSIVSVIKGYFQGIENMIPSSIAQIFEQIIKLALGLYFSQKMMYMGVAYGVLGAIIGVTISETFTLIIMTFNYVWYKKRENYKFFVLDAKYENIKRIEFKLKVVTRNVYTKPIIKKRKRPTSKLKILHFFAREDYLSYRCAYKNILKLAFPISLSSIIIPLSSLFDSFMVVNVLLNEGFSTVTATSLYGISNGVVSSLISLPIIVTTALSTAIVPNLSGLIFHKSREEVGERASFYIKLTFLIALPMFLVFLTLSPDIINFLYGSGLNNRVVDEKAFAAIMLFISSVSIVYHCFLSTFISILNAIGKPLIPFWIMSGGLVVRTLLCYLLVGMKNINVFGVVIANTVFLSLSAVICIIMIKRHLPIFYSADRGFVRPAICSFITGITVFALKYLLKPYLVNWIYIGICGLVMLIVYFVLILLFKVFTKYELKFLPNKKIFKKFKD